MKLNYINYYNINTRNECIDLVIDAFGRLRDCCRKKSISLIELVEKGLFIDLEYQQEEGFESNLPGLISSRNTWKVSGSGEVANENKQVEIIKDILKIIVGTAERLYRGSLNSEIHELCSQCFIRFRLKGDTLFVLHLENQVDRRKRFDKREGERN